MATTYTTDDAAQKLGRKTLYLDHRTVVFTNPVFIIADVVEMVPVFKDEQVVSVEVLVTDLDTNGSPLMTFDVGDGDDVDRFIVASTVARTGGIAKHTVGCPYSYSEDDTIDFKVKAAPATGVVGTVTMSVLVK